ncbi:MAG: hypothetical protein J5I90_17990 [Caldilineales bacterium]|nr:hypothetical protein [Caldilineales bacterium]
MIVRKLGTIIPFALALIALGSIQPHSVTNAAQSIGNSDYATTVQVLQQKANALAARFQATEDCAFQHQRAVILDAIMILANGENDTTLVQDIQKQRANSSGACPSPIIDAGASAVAVRATGSLTGEGAGDGCSTGLIAALMTLDDAEISTFVETAGLELDADALSAADYLILDVTDAGTNSGSVLDVPYIDAKCPGSPGIDGMIFSYYLMDEEQRREWQSTLPPEINAQINRWTPLKQQPTSNFKELFEIPPFFRGISITLGTETGSFLNREYNLQE